MVTAMAIQDLIEDWGWIDNYVEFNVGRKHHSVAGEHEMYILIVKDGQVLYSNLERRLGIQMSRRRIIELNASNKPYYIHEDDYSSGELVRREWHRGESTPTISQHVQSP